MCPFPALPRPGPLLRTRPDEASWPPTSSSHPAGSCRQGSTALPAPVSDAPPGGAPHPAAAPCPGCPVPTRPRSPCSAPPPGLTGQEAGCRDTRDRPRPQGKGGFSGSPDGDGADHVLTTGLKPECQRPPPRPGPHLQLQAAPLLLRDLALQGLLLLQQLLQGQRRPVQPQLLTASLQLWGRASKAVSLSVWVAVGETRRPGCLAGGLLLPPWPPRPLTPGSGRGLGGLLGRYPQEPVSLSLPLLESQVVEVAREDQGSRRTFPQEHGEGPTGWSRTAR